MHETAFDFFAGIGDVEVAQEVLSLSTQTTHFRKERFGY